MLIGSHYEWTRQVVLATAVLASLLLPAARADQAKRRHLGGYGGYGGYPGYGGLGGLGGYGGLGGLGGYGGLGGLGGLGGGYGGYGGYGGLGGYPGYYGQDSLRGYINRSVLKALYRYGAVPYPMYGLYGR